jgi:hypothetical protein
MAAKKTSGGQPGARLPKGPTPQKAETMLQDNSAQGHALTKKQKGFFGSIIGRAKASGRLPKG